MATEEAITRIVTEEVIQGFEPIEIESEQADRSLPSEISRLREFLQECPAIGQAR